jgi:hypothetical protein
VQSGTLSHNGLLQRSQPRIIGVFAEHRRQFRDRADTQVDEER